MIFEIHSISEPLSKWVESIFYFKNPIAEHTIERVVPTGHVFLIFEFDDIPRHTYDPVTFSPTGVYTKAWISGMHQDHLSISVHPNSEMLVVQFKTTGAYPFLHVPLEELNESVVLAEVILGNTILNLRDEIRTSSEVAAKFRMVEQWLLQRAENSGFPSEELLAMVIELSLHPFSAHQDIIQQYAKSQKTLIQQFKKYCGLTPKTLHRIFRFQKLLEIIKEKKEINWIDIAYETGFSDQAHFIKEFHNFCGFNPSEYIRNGYNQQEPNFFPLDKKN